MAHIALKTNTASEVFASTLCVLAARIPAVTEMKPILIVVDRTVQHDVLKVSHANQMETVRLDWSVILLPSRVLRRETLLA
jgi:hypothetical protein